MDISIIIPTKNEVDNIGETLKRVFNQKTKYSFEVIVIDSGSTDGTLEVIKAFISKVKLIQIEPEEFGHGKTRNLGARMAKGNYLVFLNADVWPKNEEWLDFLIKGFGYKDNVAGVYSKQIPKHGCDLYMERSIYRSYKNEMAIIQGRPEKTFFTKYRGYSYFSTVSAAIKREVFNKICFDDTIPFGEDQDWAVKVLEAGYSIIYEPKSIVYHSHNYNPKELFNFYYTSSKILHKILVGRRLNLLEALIIILVRSIISIFEDIFYILRRKGISLKKKLEEMGISFIARPFMYSGMYLGRFNERRTS